MKKIRFFLAAVLCMSMMAFVGCGADNKDAGDTGDGTVKEETVDRNYDKKRRRLHNRRYGRRCEGCCR